MDTDKDNIIRCLAIVISEKEAKIEKLKARISELTDQCNELYQKSKIVDAGNLREYMRHLDETIKEDCGICPIQKCCEEFAEHQPDSLCHFLAVTLGEE